MSNTVEKLQNSKIGIALALIGALGGLAAIMGYIDKKKHQKVDEEISNLDREIKQLQLMKLKNGG